MNHGRFERKGMIVEAVRLVEPMSAWPLWASDIREMIKKKGLPILVGFFRGKKAAYGDWVVFSDDGEFYVYSDRGFNHRYNHVENDATPCAEKALFQGQYQVQPAEVE